MRVRLTPAQTKEMVAELEAIVERWATTESSDDTSPSCSASRPSSSSTADVFVLLDVFATRQVIL
jgi:hypothetical protein